MIIDRRFWFLTSLSLWAASSIAFESIGCPTLPHGYGPYDYRTITKAQIVLVEGAHFFPNVENLRDGTPHPNRGYAIVPGYEIDYTLRVFPNHHRALMALSRLSIRDKTERPKGVRANVECYFKAAMDFREEDANVYLLYGIHLSKKGRISEALEYFDKAKALGDDSANLHYNLGLAYFQLKQFDESLVAAHKAYAAGFPLDGLKNMLKRASKWSEPKQHESLGTTQVTDKSPVDSVSEPTASVDKPAKPVSQQ
jgi:tetratricopeptide (TPR) repeat protein